MQQLEEATEWFLRLQGESSSESDISAWIKWCEDRPGNLETYEQVQQDSECSSVTKVARSARSGLPKWFAPALAAGVVIAVMTFSLWPRTPVRQSLSTVQSNSAATLPDGSSLILSAQTSLNVDFSGPQRQLTLAQGEAYFKVHHDKTRPFVVWAGDLSVTAVGTAFDVRRDQDRVVVTVEEGTVEILSPPTSTGGSPSTWRAEAGYQLSYLSDTRTANLVSINPKQQLMWREGELAYIGKPLGSVIADLNRYSGRHIDRRPRRGATGLLGRYSRDRSMLG